MNRSESRPVSIPRTWTVDEAASIWQISPRTLRRWLQQGLPHVRICRTIRLDPLKAQRWFDTHERSIKAPGDAARRQRSAQISDPRGSVLERLRSRSKKGGVR